MKQINDNSAASLGGDYSIRLHMRSGGHRPFVQPERESAGEAFFIGGNMSFCYVYFIQKKSGAVKIGVSSNLDLRIKTLQTGNCEQLELIAKLPFTSRKQAYEFEKFLHKKFEKHKLSGEWFKRKIINLFWPSNADVPDYVKYKFDCSLTDEQRSHMNSICTSI